MAEPDNIEQGDFLEQSGEVIGVSALRAPEMSITIPDEDQRLLLTEEQVDTLCRGGRDMSFEWVMALGGAAVGLLQNVIAVFAALSNEMAPAMIDILLSFIFMLCVAGAIAKFTEHRRTKTDIDKMLMLSGRR